MAQVHHAALTRALIRDHKGARSYADLSRAMGEVDRWVSNLLTQRSPTYGKLPRIDQINRLAAELRIPAARLLLTIAVDGGLVDGGIVTPDSIAMGSAFRSLSAERQQLAIAIMQVLAEIEFGHWR